MPKGIPKTGNRNRSNLSDAAKRASRENGEKNSVSNKGGSDIVPFRMPRVNVELYKMLPPELRERVRLITKDAFTQATADLRQSLTQEQQDVLGGWDNPAFDPEPGKSYNLTPEQTKTLDEIG